MNNKEDNFKEKFRQALISTAKVISDDYKVQTKYSDKNASSKNTNFFEIDNLSNKSDFIKLRAESDSLALKKKFSNKNVFDKNVPNNLSCKSLYAIAEKIRCETLGSKMLKGIQKNLKENYNQKINLNNKDSLKNKEDVPISEAFELYMLKNFLNIKLDFLAIKKLDFWEKDFNFSIEKHMEFLNKNLWSSPTWLYEKKVISKIKNDGVLPLISNLQKSAFNRILSVKKLNDMISTENTLEGSGLSVFKLIEYLTDNLSKDIKNPDILQSEISFFLLLAH